MKPNREIPGQFIQQLYQAASMDLRISQFMECIKSVAEQKGKDFFNLENQQLVDIIEEWINKTTIKNTQ